MKLPDASAFLEQLRTTGEYKTPADKLGKPRKNGFWTSFSYNFFHTFKAMRFGSYYAKRKEFTDERWAEAGTSLMWAAEKFGTEVTCEGFSERAAYKGAVVYVSNHVSLFETFAFPSMALAFGEVGIVLKESLLKVPLLGNAFKTKKVIPLGRQNPREDLKQVLTLGEKFLREGTSIVLYPQGHRTTTFDVHAFNTIGLKLAQTANVPVVPIAVQTNFLGVGKYTKDFGPVDVNCPVKFACGPVLPVDKSTAKKVQQQCIDFIADKLSQWGKIKVVR